MARKIKYHSLFKKAKSLFYKYIKLSYCNSNGKAKCVTCSKTMTYGNNDFTAGHFIPAAIRGTCFEKDNVHPQCLRCNRHLSSNPVNYYRYMRDTFGESKIDELVELSKRDKMCSSTVLQNLVEYYTPIVDKLEKRIKR
jgi:hypothetical protein